MTRNLLIASDAWSPQVNGVVRTLKTTKEHLENEGWKVQVLHPGMFRSFPCPVYPEIPLSLPSAVFVRKFIEKTDPQHIHIATEGPVGAMMRRYCVKKKLNFTTSFHTLFPDYLAQHALIPRRLTWGYLRWFHSASRCVMAPSRSVIGILQEKRFKNVALWSRGINGTHFAPRVKEMKEVQRPLLLYAGRVSREKNIEAFLRLEVPGTKYVVGDGPIREPLQKKYRAAKFFGYVDEATLSRLYAEADVFVFPSRTDTFGNVMLEALASGTPVAAYPVPGPQDIIVDPKLGALDEDLGAAIAKAIYSGSPDYCVQYARSFSWKDCTQVFSSQLVPVSSSAHTS